MDSLKSPGGLIAVTTAVGLVGTSAYFYKKIQNVDDELQRYSDTLMKVAKQLQENQNDNAQINSMSSTIRKQAELIQGFQDISKGLRQEIEENKRILRAILEALEGEDIHVDLKKKKSKAKSRKVVSESESESEEEEDEDEDYLEKLKPKKKKKQQKGKKKKDDDDSD